MKQGAEWFAYLKQVLKLYTRQRDKTMMLNMIEEVRKDIPDNFKFVSNTWAAGYFETLPRPIHDLLRTTSARLQVGQRVQ